MRTYVVTGSASGIGKATKELLEERGNQVIGIDLANADLELDLSTAEERDSLYDAVAAASGGSIDAIIAVAGVARFDALTVKVNHFGAVATLEKLRPLLNGADAPRAVVVSSFSSLQDNDPQLVELLHSGDEAAAVARADELAEQQLGHLIYASTKRSISEWVRTQSITPEWAGAGIPLNAVGPGVIITPMTAPLMQTQEGRDQLAQIVPMPLNGPAEPIVIARMLAWLASDENTHMAGQTVYVDGGADVAIRGAHVFGTQA
ncbi:SDR family oxidoreductase [Salinibacterium sp. ZJ77]|uniref:SDR family oxidoreductase n=1 Tax=Salinibacterium sp. ZJ77 TaxID=2708337 RepID=UPI00141EA933|nr:SDR family oxidoreductase [Salinibacterium sp. ZJ77]